eukprot:TRINITY_DN4051_c0_g1_i1.p1 TRINITY_DN4051_c0_g1~~TRINITY_DN4051_c0_g1_i1.p1  ORF type:complete len:455 (-),score=108.50 TRINITY_DN4051_c0_g1_i1:59-1423(-)
MNKSPNKIANANKNSPSTSKKNGSNKKNEEIEYEFGGTYGVSFVMVSSHLLLLYIWTCFKFYNGQLAPPLAMFQHLSEFRPSFEAIKIYVGFFLFQVLTASFVPGFFVETKRVDNGEKLVYNCNAIQAWYITLALSIVAQFTGIYDLSNIIENLAPLTVTSIIFADSIAIIAYLSATVTRRGYKVTGNKIYDFFIGAWLHPRIGNVDLKMFSEIRWSWFILFNLTLSSAVSQYKTYGTVSVSMVFMVIAHWLYTNACAKGEDLVTSCFDLVYEKWGWLLIFWNYAGVPFLYCSSSVYLSKVPPFQLSTIHYIICFSMLFFGYYLLDTANAQKNSFRMRLANPKWKPRGTFPQLPWAYLTDKASYLNTKAGSKLLTDGWWKWTRKPHYFGDMLMSFSWGLITGFDSFLPYIYCFSFFFILLHRRLRDEHRCALKYGEDWNIYLKRVPYIYIYGVY